MKQAAMRLSLICAFSIALIGTTCGAFPLKGKNDPQPGASPAPVSTPELQSAEQRVKACEDQLNVAKKQLSAAKSLLKAAEADLKAAKADRDALALRNQANGLAEEAGMPTPPKSLAQVNSAPPSAPTTAVAPPTSGVRTQPMDYASEAPTPEATGEPAPSIQLR